MVIFIVNRGDCDTFKPNWQRDKEYSKMLNKAHSAGVDIQAVGIEFRWAYANIDQPLQLILRNGNLNLH